MTAEEEKLYVMGILFAIIGITMIGLFATGSRKTGPEVFGDKIWWNKYRPVHGALYLWFAYLATHNQPYAWQVLAFDTTFGLYLFLANRYLL